MAHVEEDYVVLRDYVGAPHSDNEFIDNVYHRAEALVDKVIGSASVPALIRMEAILECGSELYHKRSSPMGVSQFATADGSPIRQGLDPMRAAMKVLQPFLKLGFA